VKELFYDKPLTNKLTLCSTLPPIFRAVHTYVPASSILTCGITKNTSLMVDVSGKGPSILDHVTVGIGSPGKQFKSISLDDITEAIATSKNKNYGCAK
jgi:hypothetical protein